MAQKKHPSDFRTNIANRWHAWRATRAAAATGFVSQPEPRTIGSFARGKQLVAGNCLFAGHLVNAPGVSLWDVPPPSIEFSKELQGFVWLDDLASFGDFEARQLAQEWILGWIDQFGPGKGPGWSPDLTGRRLIRWINHALFLLAGMPSDDTRKFFSSLGQQTIFLSRRWQGASPGLPRFEALTGLIYAGLSLTGMESHVAPAVRALARECREQVDAEGGIPTRNPEELLEVFTLLNWAASALSESGNMAAHEHLAAIERIAPTLRALRHADGALARFHGGGRGIEGRLDHALASSGIRGPAHAGLSMGFARLTGGRTSIVMDAARPPQGWASANAHASTLAFELTSGRRPLIVSCGSGAQFGEEWRKAGRATPSHSTLSLKGVSSSRLGRARRGQLAYLKQIPNSVQVQPMFENGSTGIFADHDGYMPSHGLLHMRKLELSMDGREVQGEETLAALGADNQRRFDAVMDARTLQGIPFSIRFHLHPDVDAQLDLGGTAVSMALKSGEIWIFRHQGQVDLKLESSVYMEKTRLKPRATKQVVLRTVAMDYATRIRWSLAKAHETPSVIRDLEVSDRELPM
ncbi:heparinase II/III family protein [Aliiroseovarius sp. KMU-50]|uniref:Heparinase II/III family protein n=1 Tax=Aliiroseovarius salicola TaxID=3009082 RepID=A0ABT4VYB7_9RHOB|nr:heparinase II/III family protein [Aliiroseovarius sp. KMU-50]MDA5092725.1 heparinase II/III family protein [Aliiroseovarius sp. KMU-50]